MQQEAARRRLEEVLCHAYDENALRQLLANLLGDEALLNKPTVAGNYIWKSYQGHIRQYKHLAKYRGPDDEEMDVLAVELQDGANLDRARTMQRNYVAEHLKQNGRDAAVVAFYAPGRSDWRLSFVRLEYQTKEAESGQIDTTAVLTPARRYSFLVGEGEPSHTAQQQLFGLLVSEAPPTVDRIERAFEIERVTKAFFAEYKELFLDLKEDLDDERHRLPTVEAEFQRCRLTSEGFAKKLLGQIVFLYFVQKKGWLGVPREAAWGEGPKDFLRRLFEKRYGDYDNFFDDRLEPLFYEALATERGADSYYHPFDCRIPFLNGGLFEPPSGYAWERVPLHLPDETFRKVFDTFDRYNFTVREDEPLEKEVAVDPEMLGKVFENLLEVKDRKAKGAFYTPREIVAYMCNESLVAYLDDALNGDRAGGRRLRRQALTREAAPQNDMFRGTPPVQGALAVEEEAPVVSRADLEALVREGERWAENDRRVREAGRETDTYRWAAPEAVRTHAAAIDKALQAITVCDPAIGSGAFPVGMMQAVVRVREALTPYLDAEPANAEPASTGGSRTAPQTGRSAYAFKRHAIQHGLYGVDIEPSAVDVAQLRLWLSLVVDEDDFRTIHPLPNLRYKILEGDALGGIEHSLENNDAYDRLQRLIPQHVEASSPVRKERLQQEIDGLIEQVTGGVFDFNVYFGDVLHKNGGFDVVIGNPPYVQQESLSREQKQRYKKRYEVYHGMADLYTYFLEQGIRLLRLGGVISYITSNSYLNADFAERLREYLATRVEMARLIDFAETPVFDAVIEPAVLIATRRIPEPGSHVWMLKWNQGEPLGLLRTITDAAFVDRLQSELDGSYWQLERPEVLSLLRKLVSTGRTLGDIVGDDIYYGIKTGLNAAFTISAVTRARLIEEDPNSADLIKPYLRGRDIRKYCPAPVTQYMIRIPNGWTDQQTNATDKWAWFQQAYPAVARHLAPYEAKARKRHDKGKYWWELRPCKYYTSFVKPKIVYQEINRTDAYAYDDKGLYINNKVFMLPDAPLYLLGLLNSSTVTSFIHTYSGVPMGGFLALQSPIIKAVPVPGLNDDQREEIEQRVRQLLVFHTGTPAEVRMRQAEICRLEREVDEIVYGLYGLTEEEIALVERRVGANRKA